jgi:cytochrome P450
MEIIGNALIFFLAGFDTTATAMSWVFYNLALNEDVQQTLFDEIENALEDNNVGLFSDISRQKLQLFTVLQMINYGGSETTCNT